MTFPTTIINVEEKKHQNDDNKKRDDCSGDSISTKGAGDAWESNQDEESGGESLTQPRKRMKIIDETLLPPEEAEKLLAKRAYNRECANRARYRGKQIVNDLNKKVQGLEEDKSMLRSSLRSMEKQVELLQKQNEKLMIKISELSRMNSSAKHIGMPTLPTISNASLHNKIRAMNQQRLAGVASSPTTIDQLMNGTRARSLEYYNILQQQVRK